MQWVFLELDMPAKEEIVEDRHVHEQPQVLESPGNTPSGNFVRRKSQEAFAIEYHLTLLWAIGP